MRRFILHSVLFLATFFVVDKMFYFFLHHAPTLEYDTRLEQVLQGKMNKEILILGSSRGANNILAGQIESKTRHSTYNLSYPGSDVRFHYFVLKSVLKYNKKPKMVVLTIDNPHEFVNEKTLNFRFDRLYPLAKYNYITQELIRQKEKNVLSWVFCLARLNRSNFSVSKVAIPLDGKIDAWGSMPFYNRKASFIGKKNSVQLYDRSLENTEKIIAFKALQQLCLKNKIQLVYVFPPSYGAFDKQFYKRFLKMVPAHDVMVYNTLNMIYQNEASFHDESHLQQKAAQVFTNEISTFIQNKNYLK